MSLRLPRRTKTAVQNLHIKTRTQYVSDGGANERYQLNFIPTLSRITKTGCWTHDGSEHFIYLNEGAWALHDDLKTGDKLGITKAIYLHEWMHSIMTERDHRAISDQQKLHGIPFNLWNLAEDARIEYAYRTKYRKKFGWLKWNDGSFDISNPKSILLAFIHCEITGTGYNVSALRNPKLRGVYSDPMTRELARKIGRFYRRFVSAATTLDLVPVLVDWLKEFPEKAEGENPVGSGVHGGDLSDSMILDPEGSSKGRAKSPSGEEKGGKDTEGDASHGAGSGDSICDPKDGEEVNNFEQGKYEPSHATPSGPKRDGAKGVDRRSFEEKDAARIASMLSSAFRSKMGVGKQKSSSPSRRLRMREIVSGAPVNPYTVKRNNNRGVPHISIVMDCSGSMGGRIRRSADGKEWIRHDSEGRVLLYALRDLAKTGVITGKVYLSACGGAFHTFDLGSATAKDIDQCRHNHSLQGSEGFVHTFPKHMAEIAKSKIALVYTDAQITDGPIPVKQLHEHGVYTIGLYVGTTDVTESMKEYGFDQQITRETATKVADVLARRLATVG